MILFREINKADKKGGEKAKKEEKKRSRPMINVAQNNFLSASDDAGHHPQGGITERKLDSSSEEDEDYSQNRSTTMTQQPILVAAGEYRDNNKKVNNSNSSSIPVGEEEKNCTTVVDESSPLEHRGNGNEVLTQERSSVQEESTCIVVEEEAENIIKGIETSSRKKEKIIIADPKEEREDEEGGREKNIHSSSSSSYVLFQPSTHLLRQKVNSRQGTRPCVQDQEVEEVLDSVPNDDDVYHMKVGEMKRGGANTSTSNNVQKTKANKKNNSKKNKYDIGVEAEEDVAIVHYQGGNIDVVVHEEIIGGVALDSEEEDEEMECVNQVIPIALHNSSDDIHQLQVLPNSSSTTQASRNNAQSGPSRHDPIPLHAEGQQLVGGAALYPKFVFEKTQSNNEEKGGAEQKQKNISNNSPYAAIARQQQNAKNSTKFLKKRTLLGGAEEEVGHTKRHKKEEPNKNEEDMDQYIKDVVIPTQKKKSGNAASSSPLFTNTPPHRSFECPPHPQHDDREILSTQSPHHDPTSVIPPQKHTTTAALAKKMDNSSNATSLSVHPPTSSHQGDTMGGHTFQFHHVTPVEVLKPQQDTVVPSLPNLAQPHPAAVPSSKIAHDSNEGEIGKKSPRENKKERRKSQQEEVGDQQKAADPGHAENVDSQLALLKQKRVGERKLASAAIPAPQPQQAVFLKVERKREKGKKTDGPQDFEEEAGEDEQDKVEHHKSSKNSHHKQLSKKTTASSAQPVKNTAMLYVPRSSSHHHQHHADDVPIPQHPPNITSKLQMQLKEKFDGYEAQQLPSQTQQQNDPSQNNVVGRDTGKKNMVQDDRWQRGREEEEEKENVDRELQRKRDSKEVVVPANVERKSATPPEETSGEGVPTTTTKTIPASDPATIKRIQQRKNKLMQALEQEKSIEQRVEEQKMMAKKQKEDRKKDLCLKRLELYAWNMALIREEELRRQAGENVENDGV